MKVKELYLYPIKSLQGIKVPSATVLEKGFRYDRRMMLVDENGVFITQRKHSILHKFNLELAEDHIRISFNGIGEIKIPLTLSSEETEPVQVWDSTLRGIIAPDFINDWFSKAIDVDCSLVYMPENVDRLIAPDSKITVSLADEYPYLILGEASMIDLNSRLDESLPIHRFRPNVVFEGGQAYEEDVWESFTIGDIIYNGVTPCVRCVFTTINQETGDYGKEPLKTLNTYRKQGKGVIFGLHAYTTDTGNIKVGDELVVLNKKT